MWDVALCLSWSGFQSHTMSVNAHPVNGVTSKKTQVLRNITVRTSDFTSEMFLLSGIPRILVRISKYI